MYCLKRPDQITSTSMSFWVVVFWSLSCQIEPLYLRMNIWKEIGLLKDVYICSFTIPDNGEGLITMDWIFYSDQVDLISRLHFILIACSCLIWINEYTTCPIHKRVHEMSIILINIISNTIFVFFSWRRECGIFLLQSTIRFH